MRHCELLKSPWNSTGIFKFYVGGDPHGALTRLAQGGFDAKAEQTADKCFYDCCRNKWDYAGCDSRGEICAG